VTQSPEEILQPIYVPVDTAPIVESSPYPVLEVPAEPLGEPGTEPLPMPETLEAPASHVPPLANLPPDAPATFLEQGEEAFAMGQYDEARRLVRRAVIALPDDPYAQLDYGLVHFALGDYEIAAQAFRRAMAEDPDLLDRMPNVATAYGVPGDFDRHLAGLKDRVFHEPTDTHARFLYGVVLVSSGDPESAVSQLSRVLHQDPRDTMAYLLRDAALRALHTERRSPSEVVVPEAP
jgi:tetratricopeptide (TPR) repeat protein